MRILLLTLLLLFCNPKYNPAKYVGIGSDRYEFYCRRYVNKFNNKSYQRSTIVIVTGNEIRVNNNFYTMTAIYRDRESLTFEVDDGLSFVFEYKGLIKMYDKEELITVLFVDKYINKSETQ